MESLSQNELNDFDVGQPEPWLKEGVSQKPQFIMGRHHFSNTFDYPHLLDDPNEITDLAESSTTRQCCLQ